MKEKLKKDELQSIQVSTGEFEIIEDTKMQQPLEENLQTTEANLQQDMQAGQQLIQNVDQAPAFAQKVIQPEISLDEQFKTAHQRAHENELHPAKLKKSTLKKRRKEYKRKTTEQSAMLAVKAQLEDMKSGPLRTGLMAEFSNKLGDEQHTTGDPEYMGKMMDAVMYMAKSEQLSVTELTIISHDLSLDVKNLTKADSLQKDVRDRYNGKMLIYEKLFKDVLSWNIDEFALKDNHVMAKDANLGKKMEKLSLLPMLRTAFKEYKAACDDSGFESQMEQFRDKKDRDRRFPEDLFGELESRLTYFEDVKAEYDCRIDLMSNKYYALLGQSDTANLKLPQLEELSTKKDMDPELRAYYDAIKRHRSRKDTGRSLKGKKPKNTLAKIRKEKNVKAPDAKFNTTKEDWARSFGVNYKNTNKSRQEKFIEHGGLNIANFKCSVDSFLDGQMEQGDNE